MQKEAESMKLKLLTVGMTILANLSIATAAINPNPIEQWSPADHWETTQISLEGTVFRNVNQSTCFTGPKYLIACLATVNKAISLIYPNTKKIAHFEPKSESEFAPFVVKDYSQLGYEEFFRIQKAYYDKTAESYINSYKTLVTPNFNIDKVFAKLKDSVMTENNDQYITGQIFNEFLIFQVDPHTYLKPASINRMDSQGFQRQKGIGINYAITELDGKEYIILKGIVPNSPAQKFGLNKGDLLLSVNKTIENEQMIDHMGDAQLETLTFEVMRDGEVVSIQLNKGFIAPSNVTSTVIEKENENYGYIKLSNFMQEGSCEAIESAGTKMIAESDIKGLILDLRDNGGGRVDFAQCIMKLFLEDGSKVWAVEYLDIKDHGILETRAQQTNNIFGNMHTVTLINGYSASASEATSMFLKDYRKTFVVGERSYGKGSMQSINRITENMLQASTSALYYGPKGITPQVHGVIPDFISRANYGQQEATDFQREEDGYMYPLTSDVKVTELISGERVEDKKVISDCLESRGNIEKIYNSQSKYQKLIFDNQLETGLEVLACANENISIHKGIEIQEVEGVKFITAQELRELL